MSSISSPETFVDLYTDLQNRAREDTGVTATETQAKRYINIALQDMHLGFGEKFIWSERRAVLNTNPQYTTGLLTVNQAGTIITGVTDASGDPTAWNTIGDFSVNNVRIGGRVTIAGGTEVYEITGVSSDTKATIGSIFLPEDITGSTQTDNGATYVYFEDEYDLAPDFLRPIDQQRFSDGPTSVDLVGRTEFRRRYPANRIPGRPRIATLIDLPPRGNTTLRRRIKFHRPADKAYQIKYAYVTNLLVTTSAGVALTSFVNDDDEPIVPHRYRHIIGWNALQHWYRDKKDDQRSAEVKAEYVDGIFRMTADQEIGQSRPQFRPRISHYKHRAARPWGGSGRGRGKIYDINGEFDRLE